MTTTHTTPSLGTVSHGTMKVEDLIPTFLDTLRELDDRAELALRVEYLDTIVLIATIDYFDLSQHTRDRADYLLESLWDALDACAPEGCYFGAIEGDGADYGFWQYADPFADDDEIERGDLW